MARGTRLGPYVIEDLLGSGGMGEVYRARDTRLGRAVAIKVLSRSLAGGDVDRLAREAQATSRLNHPNILAIYDVGRHEGISFLVSELLEGQTLSELLGEGPLAPRRAVDYALQVARGLAAAHERGIVHRDLKPGNLFVSRDDRIKILDFGLALVAPHPEAAGEWAGKSTVQGRTRPGTVLGTFGYMSPEQARGEWDPLESTCRHASLSIL